MQLKNSWEITDLRIKSYIERSSSALVVATEQAETSLTRIFPYTLKEVIVFS